MYCSAAVANEIFVNPSKKQYAAVMKSAMFLLCVYAICTKMHKEEKMAALKGKEQQQDKRKMQSMETLTAVGR